MTGTLYVISAPSGTGKTTLVKSLLEIVPNLTVSISHTTRSKRPLEIHGVNYYFIEQDQFKNMIENNDFLEYATVFDCYYGTSKTWVNEALAKGQDVILEIDWQGCQQIQKLFPQAISIFILPPSLEDLAKRLVTRNQDKPEIIKKRLADTQETLSHLSEFDYLVINDEFQTALKELECIIQAQRLRTSTQSVRYSKLIKDLSNVTDAI